MQSVDTYFGYEVTEVGLYTLLQLNIGKMTFDQRKGKGVQDLYPYQTGLQKVLLVPENAGQVCC